MDKNTKIKIIERFDTYFSGINNKGAFILAINTLIISGLLVGLKDLQSMISCYDFRTFNIVVAAIMILSIISMLLTILAIIPFIRSSKNSFWFFNDIAKKPLNDFLDQIDNQTEERQIKDLNEQIHYLAVGLRRKHRRVRIALMLNIGQIILLFVLTYLLLR